jgi:hypothetical protein
LLGITGRLPGTQQLQRRTALLSAQPAHGAVRATNDLRPTIILTRPRPATQNTLLGFASAFFLTAAACLCCQGFVFALTYLTFQYLDKSFRSGRGVVFA